MYIIDARPRLNAVANQFKGLGYETKGFFLMTNLFFLLTTFSGYENATISFLNIQNIHKMRDAQNKLRKVCLGEEKLTKVDSTKWLRIPPTKKNYH